MYEIAVSSTAMTGWRAGQHGVIIAQHSVIPAQHSVIPGQHGVILALDAGISLHEIAASSAAMTG